MLNARRVDIVAASNNQVFFPTDNAQASALVKNAKIS